ncbi:MAG: Fic family protein [Runella slithyformis]|nr:MAG: Fic family protein [Runella slithyformis]TAG22835.1 MAG: Fic family protein [Cytophagales bacterium]TAG40603.1 MAG: Fic family protein [Cytophagia bacterium]TAE95039.1 MAG: Fic family protein [Runella slithyformis]TAF23248.1 MAG: Fic family protein [Runella slithyformis]
MDKLFSKIRQSKTELDALRPLEKDRELAVMQKLRLDWNYHSNHLEGNTLSYGETKALILFGITAQGKPLKDHFEITGHDEAVKWIEEVVKEERPLTENFIRELHKLILKQPYETKAITPEGATTYKQVKVGQYKTTPNHVKTQTGEIFRFATPEETPALMHDLLEWYRHKKQELDTEPLLLAAEFHYKFIRIHPFDDGNGRTARILMNFILMQSGYPPVVIKTEDKQLYISVLQQADADILEPFFNYIGQNLLRSLDIMLKGAKGEPIEDPNDLDKEIALLEQKLKGVGEKVQVKSSAESTNRILLKTIPMLHSEMEKVADKFKNFYFSEPEQYLHFIYSPQKPIVSFSPVSDFYALSTNEMNEKLKAIDAVEIEYRFGSLNRVELAEKFSSKIRIKFDELKYSIAGDGFIKSIEKLYHQSFLNEVEIAQIVKAESKRHLKFIEEQIEAHTHKKVD